MTSSVADLAQKLEAMTAEQIAEVNDFVDFLRSRTADRNLTRQFAKASEPSFAAVWDNPEDDIYDEL